MSTDKSPQPDDTGNTALSKPRTNGAAHATLALILSAIVIAGLVYGVIETLVKAAALF